MGIESNFKGFPGKDVEELYKVLKFQGKMGIIRLKFYAYAGIIIAVWSLCSFQFLIGVI